MKRVGAKIGIVFLSISILGASMSGCTKDAQSEQSIVYRETKESQMDRGMDNQPESSYWFPEDLLAWRFDEDEDAPYNVSAVPLKKRVDKASLSTSNDTQNTDMKVVALSIMNDSTSGNAPRGINTFDANVFSNWQYIDQLVYWGGSSGEGIIVPPSPDVIDAAHKNGVPVLGTIFFPQTAHGGKIEWLDTFLEKDSDGNFPIVDKMVEVAETYGFDGWFINQETDTEVTSFDEAAAGSDGQEEKEAPAENGEVTAGLSKEHADLMQELIVAFKEKAEHLDIMWYDSMTVDGEMDWQNALTDKNQSYLVDAALNPVADSMFLNFWWNTDKYAQDELLKASQEKAEELDLNSYDLFAGIDVQEEGYMTPVKWDLFTDDKGIPYTSLGLYVPSWTHHSASDTDDFQSREEAFWVNAQGDPTKGVLPEGAEWPGISTYAVEQTAITQFPFVTHFNVGNGYNYFIEGEKVSSMDWNNRSMQDIMPTYRWIFNHSKENNLKVRMDYADAFNGGNALLLRGNMEAGETSTMKLYSLQAEMEKGVTFTTTAKASDQTDLELILTFEDGTTETFAGDKKVGSDWTTVTYDVEKVAGKVVTGIDYAITSTKTNDTYELRFGQIAVMTDGTDTSAGVSSVTIEDALFDEEEGNFAGVRLAWEMDEKNPVTFYEIYQINEDDSRSFLGATPGTNHYLNALERPDGDGSQTKLEVIPVSLNGARGKASKVVTLEWPDNQVPKAAFSASKTLIAPGEKVTFTNQSSTNAESYKWEFEGGDVKTSTDENPVVAFAKEGVYTVKLTAINPSGETSVELEKLITVSSKVKQDLELVSKNATATASSFVNDAEAPEFAIDGDLTTKWCATGTTPHEIILDLGELKTVSEVHLANAEAGGEGADMNTKAYTIELSTDGKEYTKVSRIINNKEANSVDTFAATPAQYVKVSIDKPTQGSDTAVRIYEMEVYGINESLNN